MCMKMSLNQNVVQMIPKYDHSLKHIYVNISIEIKNGVPVHEAPAIARFKEGKIFTALHPACGEIVSAF